VLEGAQPIERFQEVAKGELAKASALAAKGVAPDLVYTQLTESNLKEQAAAAAKTDDEDAPDTKTYKVPVGSSPVLGAKDALVTIIEFSDFQCPFCKRVEKTLGEVRAKYGNDVRFVWKNDPLPFHKRAEPAAQLALEARAEKGDKGFWEAHDALFDSQPKLEDADLEALAATLKLNVAKVKQAIATHKYKTAIEDDELVGDDFGASGTPHFFINGKRLGGAQPIERFTAIIDEELARAKALKANGTAPAALYDALVKDGVTATAPEKVQVDAPAAGAPSRGAAGAKVVVQEFADFQCPFCKRAEDTVDEVVKAYGGRVKVVWRNLPLSFHADAELAAEAALEAKAQKGNDAFWKMHDLLFKNQGVDGALQRPALDGYAQELKLDMTKWAAALDGHTHQAEIEADKHAADGAKITGTPSFVINGYSLVGAQRYIKFKRVVERALADAAKPSAHN
jgi:protein-disulfide isomerase